MLVWSHIASIKLSLPVAAQHPPWAPRYWAISLTQLGETHTVAFYWQNLRQRKTFKVCMLYTGLAENNPAGRRMVCVGIACHKSNICHQPQSIKKKREFHAYYLNMHGPPPISCLASGLKKMFSFLTQFSKRSLYKNPLNVYEYEIVWLCLP